MFQEGGGRRKEGRERGQKASWRRWGPELRFGALADGDEGRGSGLREATVGQEPGGGACEAVRLMCSDCVLRPYPQISFLPL